MYITLQRTAPHCSILQHTAIHSNNLPTTPHENGRSLDLLRRSAQFLATFPT